MGIALDERESKEDKSVDIEDIKIVYESQLEEFAAMAVIDYRDIPFLGSSFIVDLGFGC